MKLYVIGIGPGGKDDMTFRAVKALRECECVAGYSLYLDLIRDLIEGKELIETGMTKEVKRCTAARDLCLSGKTVAVISSGDAGIYGMAGLVLELCAGYDNIEAEVIPGVTAACSGGALLGSPLTGDFACISLSDLLTPWERIEKRLRCVSEADMPIAIYNPGSKSRAGHLRRACDILLEYKPEGTVCGIARNVSRGKESYSVMSLKELRDYGADMLDTIFIGCNSTKLENGRMVTPRGYRGLTVV